MNALVVPLSPQGYSASNAIVRLKKVGQGKTRQDCCKIWALKPVLQLATLNWNLYCNSQHCTETCIATHNIALYWSSVHCNELQWCPASQPSSKEGRLTALKRLVHSLGKLCFESSEKFCQLRKWKIYCMYGLDTKSRPIQSRF